MLASVIAIGCVESSSPDSSSLPQNVITPTPTTTSLITSTVTPLPSQIESSIVLIIDASESTVAEDATTGSSSISLIEGNALNIVRSIGRKNHAGVVYFGVTTRKTDILSLCSEANRAELYKFIIDVIPNGGNNLNDLDKGLRAAEDLLNSVNGTKEIIVLSDGNISQEGFDQLEKAVLDLKNEGVKIHFVQILLSNIPNEKKQANRIYNELAQISGGAAIVLNPNERVNVLFESDESC